MYNVETKTWSLTWSLLTVSCTSMKPNCILLTASTCTQQVWLRCPNHWTYIQRITVYLVGPQQIPKFWGKKAQGTTKEPPLLSILKCKSFVTKYEKKVRFDNNEGQYSLCRNYDKNFWHCCICWNALMLLQGVLFSNFLNTI